MLHTAAIIALAGNALSAEPTLEPISMGTSVSATSATPVAVDALGRIVSWGEPFQLDGNAERGLCNTNEPVFDSFGVADTDGDGFFFDPVCGEQCGLATPSSRYVLPQGSPYQGFAVDINIAAQPGRKLESTLVPGQILRCDNSQADSMQILIAVYDDIDYDTDGDTIPDTPFPPADNNGDGIPDAFLGGLLLAYSPVPDTAGGYANFIATGLDTLGIDLPADGVGGIHIQFVSEFIDLDGDTVPETPLPFEGSSPLLWGATDSIPNCSYPQPSCSSNGTVYALSYDVCNNVPLLSPDPYTYVRDEWFNVVPCPDILMPAFTLFSTCPADRLCADQNSDGLVQANDFTAWIANYNANDLRADVNQDGEITPTDFTAWISAFNQGVNGPICYP
jgi:hypothetical protein